jgi:hypothetical protein
MTLTFRLLGSCMVWSGEGARGWRSSPYPLITPTSLLSEEGSSTTASRSDIRSIQLVDFSALWSDGLMEVALNWLFPYPL